MYEAEKRVRRYERLYGQRVLRPMIAALLKSAPAPENGGVWLDWETGPGVLASELLKKLAPDATLLATDQDRAALRVFHSRPELDRDKRCFARQDTPDMLPLHDSVVDVAIGHWRWQFMSAPDRAVAELSRIVKPGGKIILSFLIPGAGGTLHDALARAGKPELAQALKEDGIATSQVRDYLRGSKVAQIEVRQVAQHVSVGATSRPMMDPLLADFLLPRWIEKATGEEVTGAREPIDLGSEPLFWDFKVGIATATVSHPPDFTIGEMSDTVRGSNTTSNKAS